MYTHIYMYIYVCLCVYVCVLARACVRVRKIAACIQKNLSCTVEELYYYKQKTVQIKYRKSYRFCIYK